MPWWREEAGGPTSVMVGLGHFQGGLRGRRWTGLGGPSHLLSGPACGKEAHHLRTISGVADAGGWLRAGPGEAPGSVGQWLLHVSLTHGASHPGRGRPEGREADFSPCVQHRGRCPVPVPHERSLEVPAAQPLPPLQGAAPQEAFPGGPCISMVTVLGVPPPTSPSSAPSRRARWKTTLRGSQSRCDLSLPARK